MQLIEFRDKLIPTQNGDRNKKRMELNQKLIINIKQKDIYTYVLGIKYYLKIYVYEAHTYIHFYVREEI